jgi:hypothetical protein
MSNDDNPSLEDSSAFAEEMLFNANLKEFAIRIGIACNLEAGGKISQLEAYQQIKALWKELKRSRKNLRISDELEE